ncbi:MAG: VWA domain-containing protein [Waddliaceae bacterium]
MPGLSFEIDFTALGIVLLFRGIFTLFRSWSQGFHTPHIKFSNLSDLKIEKKGWRESYAQLPFYLMLSALLLFSLAFIDPHFYVQKEKDGKVLPPIKQTSIPTEGIAIYLVLDQSSSMSQEVTATSPEGRRQRMTKMDLLKQVTREFVTGNPKLGLQGRPNDFVGLVSFARGSQVLSPLTLDHEAILNQLAKLEYTKDQELDGTSIGYAIFKAANLIAATKHYAEELTGAGKPAYNIQRAIMILVTDGFQSPSPLDKGKRLRNIDLSEAATYTKQKDIRLYVINVEPRIASEEFAAHRKMMKYIAESTGGRFYLVDSSLGLSKIYADIDQLEKSILPIETTYVSPPKSQLPHLFNRISLYPYLIAIGITCLFLSVLLEGTVMRKVP